MAVSEQPQRAVMRLSNLQLAVNENLIDCDACVGSNAAERGRLDHPKGCYCGV
jgi:hypothetical protein